jgi:hypothetical protein
MVKGKGYSKKANAEWRKLNASIPDTRRIPSDEELFAEFRKMNMKRK